MSVTTTLMYWKLSEAPRTGWNNVPSASVCPGVAGTVSGLVTKPPAADTGGAKPGARLDTSVSATHAARKRINFTTTPDDIGTDHHTDATGLLPHP